MPSPRSKLAPPLAMPSITVPGVPGAGSGDVDVHPGHLAVVLGPGVAVGLHRRVADRQHLQLPAGREVAGRGGHEPVEARRRGVLGEVHVAGGRVDGGRLVGVAAEADERLAGRRAVGGHLEHVAVPGGADDVGGLLAGEPRAPRRGTAGAVPDRAGQAGVRADQRAGVGVEHERGRAAAARRRRRSCRRRTLARRRSRGCARAGPGRRRGTPPCRRGRRAWRCRRPSPRRCART